MRGGGDDQSVVESIENMKRSEKSGAVKIKCANLKVVSASDMAGQACGEGVGA